jgi:hypothetical protein
VKNLIVSCCCSCGDIESSPVWLKRWRDGLKDMMKKKVSEEKVVMKIMRLDDDNLSRMERKMESVEIVGEME